jgi:hypothetical protein
LLKQVGDSLVQQAKVALRANQLDTTDAFARSAFNRFYYCAFLLARQLLLAVAPTAGMPNHRDMPEYLRGRIRRALTDELQQAERSRLLSPADVKSRRSRVLTYTDQFASLLSAAYAVRIVADYEPEIRIQIVSPADLRLAVVSTADAQKWPHEAEVYTTVLTKIWRDLGK